MLAISNLTVGYRRLPFPTKGIAVKILLIEDNRETAECIAQGLTEDAHAVSGRRTDVTACAACA